MKYDILNKFKINRVLASLSYRSHFIILVKKTHSTFQRNKLINPSLILDNSSNQDSSTVSSMINDE